MNQEQSQIPMSQFEQGCEQCLFPYAHRRRFYRNTENVDQKIKGVRK
ncbi:MAG: hypothetical protein OXD54_06870 [Candidatus Poribacteria bacterium]|nr:hypothetical protein [Candidatus Poribacteria bacterium]